MARKKIEPITGMGSDPDNKLIVQKSRPLFALWRSGLTLAEFKILDTYLSRIDSRKPDKRAVVFEKGELEQLLGVKKINNSELQERLTHLMGNVVKVDDPTKTKSFRLVSLFEEAEAEQNENGLWEVRLECTQKAMKYFFNIENLGYLRYKLRCVTSIASRYTYILFVYLEANRYRKSWEVDLDELKAILNCDTEETYKEYKRFNDRLLKRVQKEMHEKTECRYSYEPVKKGRSVVAVRFNLETLPKLVLDSDYDPAQITLENYLESSEDEHLSRLNFLRSACSPIDAEPEFTVEEMEQLLQVLTQIDQSKLPTFGLPTDDVWFARYHYLAERYANMNRIQAKTPIKNRFAYFLKMVKADA